MDDICTACLCFGRKLNFIGDVGCYEIYMQILNEMPMYDRSQVCVRVCWECRAVLHRFHRFRQQVKQSHKELMLHMQQTPPLSKLMLIKPSRLQVYNVHNVEYPEVEIKKELECDFHVEVDLSLNCVKSEDVETHCEPEAFVNDLDLEKLKEKEVSVKKKKVKKIVKETNKKKTKKKPKGIKNKYKTENSIESKDLPETNGFSDLDTGLDYCEDTEVCEELGKEENDQEVSVCDVHTCGVCAESFDNARELSKHVKNRHTIKFATVIQKCESGEEKVTKKVSRVRASKLEPLEKKPTCAECGKVFSSKKTYRYHRTVLHQGQNRHPCPRCGKVYQWKSNLGRHIRSHKARDSGELYCSVCDKRFASIATYRQHLRISRKHVSETEFSFMCNECGKKFVNKTRLRDHIDWEHLNNIKFKCQLCNKPFKCHTSLYVHMQNVHRDKEKKDNLCHVCGKSYQNAAKLKYHIVAMHTSETPYQCEQCSAAFGWYSSLYRHVREVHYKMKLQSKKSKKSKRVPPEMYPPLLLAPPPVPPPPPPHTGPQ